MRMSVGSGLARRTCATLTSILLALLGSVIFTGHHGSAVARPPAAPGDSSRLDPRITRLAATRPHQALQAIVQFRAQVSAGAARADVTRAGGHVFAALHIIPALAARLTAAQAESLAGDADVHSVSLNAVVRSSDWNGSQQTLSTDNLQTTYDQTLDVPAAWRSGATGAGIGVAVIDTGVDGDLPDFQTPDGGSRVIATAITNPSAQVPTDSYGHGTDVAGIIAGNGDVRSPSDPLYGRYIGVAPGANLISIKAADETGTATVLNVIYGLQFAVDHRSQYNIQVVNLSLDAATPQSYLTDPLDAAAESAWMHGIVVVAAAGNRGSAPDAVQYAPANDPYVITVGGVDENGTSNPADDTIAGWSSRGTTQDGFVKPDVYAPGAHIVSLLAPHSAFAGLCPGCVIGGQYIRSSGTSMAAPMISGLVADLLQARPELTPNQVKALLTSPGALSNPALHEVDAYKALWLRTPPPANQGLTPNGLITDAAGHIDYARSSWSASSWSTATGTQSAGFAASSWSCTCTGAATGTGTVGTSASSWSASSWSASSWSTQEPLESTPGAVRGTATAAARTIDHAARFAAVTSTRHHR